MKLCTLIPLAALHSGVAVAGTVEFCHSGRLMDAFGEPVNGQVSLTLRLYTTDGPDGSQVEAWSDTFSSLTVSDGLFSVVLGSQLPLPSSVLDHHAVYIEHQVGSSGVLGARQLLYRVPQAEQANRVRVGPTPDTACTDAGTVMFDSTLASMLVCDGTSWRAVQTEPLPIPPITLRIGPDGKDTYVRSSLPSNEFSDQDRVRSGGWGDTYYSLLEFDLSGVDTTPVTSATLRLYCYSTTNPLGLYIDRNTSAWVETATWNTKPGATAFTSIPAPTEGTWVEVDLTVVVNGWLDGSFANHGIRIRPMGTNNNWSQFRSGDYADDPTQWPELVLSYD